MKFGGHETFALRANWLPNGVRLLRDDPAAFTGTQLADALGVGSNMAKSISHWLVQAGLAERPKRGQPPRLTELGKLVARRDPYFLKRATWWALHVNLATRPGGPAVWSFFFSSYGAERFERGACLNEFRQWAEHSSPKQASADTRARDLGCLLASYATAVPPEPVDPEDGSECPLRRLGLLTYSPASGYYQRGRERRGLPGAVLAYAFARMLERRGEELGGRGHVDVDVEESLTDPCGPYRLFGLSFDAYGEELQAAAVSLRPADFALEQLAGRRSLRLRRRPPAKWLEISYAAKKPRRQRGTAT